MKLPCRHIFCSSRVDNGKPPWWNSRLSKLRRLKFQQFIQCKSSKYLEMREEYKRTCKLFKKEIKETVICFERKLAFEAKTKPKLLYSYIYKKLTSKETIAALEIDGQFETNRGPICDALNEFFRSVFEPASSTITKSDFSTYYKSRTAEIMEWDLQLELTEVDVLRKLDVSLDSSKAPGNDSVLNVVLKKSAASWALPHASLSKICVLRRGANTVARGERHTNI